MFLWPFQWVKLYVVDLDLLAVVYVLFLYYIYACTYMGLFIDFVYKTLL